jgi:hypothetical protein
MKRLLTCCAILALLCMAWSTAAQKDKQKLSGSTVKYKDKAGAMDMPYTATYSSRYVIGNPAMSRMVLQLWKDYDNNTLDNSANMLSDTLTAVLADGMVIKGKEAFLSGIKGYRNGFMTVSSEVQAWISTHSLDVNKETVCIWGTETDQKPDGTTQSINLHEVWFFNKDGKVDGFRQYAQVRKQ